jgi:uncharacterized protein YecE (DUF72 family)
MASMAEVTRYAPIRVGVGGWTYEPWRGPFYPSGLPHAEELAHASRRLTTIEVNGTFYGTQKPSTFRRWADETPRGFMFSLKAPRFAVNRRKLAEAGPSIERVLGSGLAELGDKLGPILWQLPPTKAFDEDDLSAFLQLLPGSLDGRPLLHALEVRHESFRDPRLVALLRRHEVALVLADSDEYPMIADLTGPFVYARLQRSAEEQPAGYAPEALDLWAARFRTFASAGEPADLPKASREPPPDATARPCFVYVISGAKVRAPAAAMALIERVGKPG